MGNAVRVKPATQLGAGILEDFVDLGKSFRVGAECKTSHVGSQPIDEDQHVSRGPFLLGPRYTAFSEDNPGVEHEARVAGKAVPEQRFVTNALNLLHVVDGNTPFEASPTSSNCPPESSTTRHIQSRFLLRTSTATLSSIPLPSTLGRSVLNRISYLFSKCPRLGLPA